MNSSLQVIKSTLVRFQSWPLTNAKNSFWKRVSNLQHILILKTQQFGQKNSRFLTCRIWHWPLFCLKFYCSRMCRPLFCESMLHFSCKTMWRPQFWVKPRPIHCQMSKPLNTHAPNMPKVIFHLLISTWSDMMDIQGISLDASIGYMLSCWLHRNNGRPCIFSDDFYEDARWESIIIHFLLAPYFKYN